MDVDRFCVTSHVQTLELDAWIEAGWLVPAREGETLHFSEIDLARAQLVHDLRDRLGVNDEGVTIVLDLVDQIHGLRAVLGELCSGLTGQSDAQRYRLAAQISAARSKRTDMPAADAGKASNGLRP